MRYWFGQGPADWTMTVGGGDEVLVAGGVTITMWSAPTGGVQIDDLLDASGSPALTVTSADGTGGIPAGTIPRFQGPDGTATLWADAGAGVRYEMRGNLEPLATDVAALDAAVDGAVAAVAGLATVASTGEYEDLVGTPALADVATSGDYADLDGAPSPGLQYVLKSGGAWPARSSSAPDTGRPAVWIGASPAPSAGGTGALDGDVWWPTP